MARSDADARTLDDMVATQKPWEVIMTPQRTVAEDDVLSRIRGEFLEMPVFG